MNQEARNPSKARLTKLIDTVAKHFSQGLAVDLAAISEDSLVQLAKRSNSSELRSGLAELYRAGYFGRHDVVNGYAWALAAWECSHASYDDKFKLAEIQQYYEYLLSADEQAQAIRILERVFSADQACHYVAGTPFNAKWWGWEDDPIPAPPGERDFKAHFVQWLLDGGYSESEISDIVARCPQSDGPTRTEKIERYADDLFGRQRGTAAGLPKTILPER